MYLINIATMDRKDWKGMYTNTFLHFLLAYNKDYFITGRANVIFCAVGLR